MIRWFAPRRRRGFTVGAALFAAALVLTLALAGPGILAALRKAAPAPPSGAPVAGWRR